MKTLNSPRILALAAAVVLALAGCAPTISPATTVRPAATGAASLTISDAWVKSAASGMSAAFGTLKNAGTAPLTIVSASSPSASALELHETVQGDSGERMMRARKGGFVVPAGGSLNLAPGANHIMLMGLTGPLKAGDESTLTLTLSDGSTYEFTAPAKDFTGANENYVTGGMGASTAAPVR
jgi:copper(I)-binding protein